MERGDLLNCEASQANEVDNENLVDRLEDLPRRYNYTFSIQPLETDLKKLLTEVSGRSDIENIKEAKLRVVSKSAGLHRLANYTPQLEILILDDSCVRSLRDLGSSLKQLSTLSVVRCYLETLDGLWGFPNLRILIARDNLIRDPSPCSAVPKLTKLDLTNNDIDNVESFVFLRNCKYLRELAISRNNFYDYTEKIRDMLPQTRVFDGVAINDSMRPEMDGLPDDNHLSSEDDDVIDIFSNYDEDIKREGAEVLLDEQSMPV